MSMTIEDVEAARARTGADIGKLLAKLEADTGCRVESIYYRRVAQYGPELAAGYVELELRLPH